MSGDQGNQGPPNSGQPPQAYPQQPAAGQPQGQHPQQPAPMPPQGQYPGQAPAPGQPAQMMPAQAPYPGQAPVPGQPAPAQAPYPGQAPGQAPASGGVGCLAILGIVLLIPALLATAFCAYHVFIDPGGAISRREAMPGFGGGIGAVFLFAILTVVGFIFKPKPGPRPRAKKFAGIMILAIIALLGSLTGAWFAYYYIFHMYIGCSHDSCLDYLTMVALPSGAGTVVGLIVFVVLLRLWFRKRKADLAAKLAAVNT